MTDAELRDNIIGFIAAGHETTAVALTWTLYLIASHKPTAARIREEIRRVAGEAPIGSEQIERLQFTRQVVQEAMRLYAPGPQLARTCTRDIEICGRPVTAGTLVLIPIFALHRHRLHWSDPDAFDPDRFAPALGAERRRYVYMPFGAGPRICIGSHFAMTEAVAILATLVRAVDVEPGRADAVEPVGGASLRPAGGLRLRLRFRPPITPRTASAAPS